MKRKNRKNSGRPKIKIVPSILSSDFSHLQDEVDRVRNADGIQFDVMDGHFVNNITFGPVVVKNIKTRLPRDVHLMIEEPERYIKAFADAGADSINFHVEAARHAMETIAMIRELGLAAGIAINPETPVSRIKELLPYLDQIIVMTVNPGWGGQSFLEECLDKIRELRQDCSYNGDIQVDGGINDRTVVLAARAGANVFVAGSFVYGSRNPAKKIELLREKAKNA
jgi:ribulose-phosphate 3-epimerase